MKLLIVITHEENAEDLESTFVEKKIHFTKLESKGGFLKQKNSTFLLACKKEQVDPIIELIKNKAKQKEETVSAPLFTGTDVESIMSSSSTVTVTVGGATILVVPLEKLIKI
ncbi:cyclic-di-AMP receptor [Patescibacteria group bacterium]|nr:cyclic-di-AMP receptor [Patescibacteria group bacterium]